MLLIYLQRGLIFIFIDIVIIHLAQDLCYHSIFTFLVALVQFMNIALGDKQIGIFSKQY